MNSLLVPIVIGAMKINLAAILRCKPWALGFGQTAEDLLVKNDRGCNDTMRQFDTIKNYEERAQPKKMVIMRMYEMLMGFYDTL